MPFCQVKHWDTDYHLPALTSILQCMQPWAKMIPAAKWHWYLQYCLFSTISQLNFRTVVFQRFFFSVGINWHSINYFVPFSFHYISYISFCKIFEICGLVPYAVNSLFIYTSASVPSYFLLHSYPGYLEFNNTHSLTLFAHISQELSTRTTPKTKSLKTWPLASHVTLHKLLVSLTLNLLVY